MKKKAVVYLSGGLGNQLFQYAFSRAIQSKRKIKTKINTTFYQRNLKDNTSREVGLEFFNIEYQEINDSLLERAIHKFNEKLFVRLFNLKSNYHNENTVNPNNIHNIELREKNFFRGYWQNHNYFDSIKEDLIKDFCLNHNLENLDQIILKKILNTNSVCIHVRRTDYIGTEYDVVNIDYYKNALNIISSKYSNLNFFIFSDDIKWCRLNLNFIPEANYCSFSLLNDFHLMSLCNHFIIPNSTFSWWSAYLSGNKNKIVIIPTIWHKTSRDLFKDASPTDWIKIKNI